MFQRSYKILIYCFFLFCFSLSYVDASNTVGSINSSSYTAQICENISCSITSTSPVNFGYFTNNPSYNVQINDSYLTGLAWSTHFGWIVLNCTNTTSGCSATNGNFKVTNDSEGNLSGYAWGENTGWINFGPFTNSSTSAVKINNNGEFNGYAWGENTGWIKFDCSVSSYCVRTDWRPRSSRPQAGFPLFTLPFLNLNNNNNAIVNNTEDTPVIENPKIKENNKEIINKDTEKQADIVTGDIAPVYTPNTQVEIPDEGIAIQGPSTPPVDYVDTSSLDSGTLNQFFNSPLSFIGSILDKDIIQKSSELMKNITSRESFSPTSNTAAVAGLVAGVSIFVPSVSPVTFLGGSSNMFGSILLGNFGLYDIWLILLRSWGLVLTYLGIRKKARPWGTVYDSVTKQPLDPVYVVLRDTYGKEVASAVTDVDGRYGFLAKAGIYSISVRKTNYRFPSSSLYNVDHDELYTDLYKGGEVSINEDGVIMKNIPMDPVKFDWNEFTKKQQNLTSFFSRHDVWVSRFSYLLFIICFLVSVISLLYVPNVFNFIIFLLYVALFVISKVFKNIRPSGRVRVGINNRPLAFAIIRVYYADLHNEYSHMVTNKNGLYYCLVPNGDYYITIENKNIDGSYTLAYTSDTIHVDKGYINQNFTIR